MRTAERAGRTRSYRPGITYILTGEGWLYLAVILDLCSRLVVGWAVSERITRELTLNALDMALVRRRGPLHGLVHHSDQGSQSVRQRRLPGSPRRRRDRLQHEPPRQLLG